MVTVAQLTLVHRGRTVLDALDLHVAPREIVALAGPEGAGKTAALVETLRRIGKRGAAILLATRDFAFAQRLATRVVLLERGAAVETIDPQASRRAFHSDSYLADLVG